MDLSWSVIERPLSWDALETTQRQQWTINCMLLSPSICVGESAPFQFDFHNLVGKKQSVTSGQKMKMWILSSWPYCSYLLMHLLFFVTKHGYILSSRWQSWSLLWSECLDIICWNLNPEVMILDGGPFGGDGSTRTWPWWWNWVPFKRHPNIGFPSSRTVTNDFLLFTRYPGYTIFKKSSPKGLSPDLTYFLLRLSPSGVCKIPKRRDFILPNLFF